MNVAIIYNEPRSTAASDHWLRRSDPTYAPPAEGFVDASEHGVLGQMQSISEAVVSEGHGVSIFSADDDPQRLCSFLSDERPDVIFNCCESILGESKLEMNVAAMYELFGIPYTGSSALTLGLALDKALTKSIFLAHGIPTPRHQLFRGRTRASEIDERLRYPLIVKPSREDASIGIDARSIVADGPALLERVHFILKEFQQPALVEEFIDGRELNVALLGASHGRRMPEHTMDHSPSAMDRSLDGPLGAPQKALAENSGGPAHGNEDNFREMFVTLPISEITFHAVPEGHPHIVSYEAKWVEESPMYQTTVPECPASLPEAIGAEARRIALAAARALGLRDYGRVDLRLDASGHLFVLEANPNPDISEDAGFMRAARASGRNYAGTINEILHLAMDRPVR